MGTDVRQRTTMAGALALTAIVAVIAALLVSDDREPIRPAYAPLGAPLARIAQTVSLPEGVVARAVHGRELVQATGPIEGSTTDRYSVTAERITDRRGRQTTALTIELGRWTGSDVILLPWGVTQVIPNEDLVLSPDFSRIRLNTEICDERDGQTKQLVVGWTMIDEPLNLRSNGMLASRGGDASFTGRYGADQFRASSEDRAGSVDVQIWPNAPTPRQTGLRLDGQRRKPVRCAR